jgi:hypothetical protein
MDQSEKRAIRNLINGALRQNLQRSDWERLEGNLAIGLIYEASRPRRLKAAIALAEHHRASGNYRQAIAAFEHARLLAPTREGIVRAELAILDDLLDEVEGVATHDDLLVLQGIVQILLPPRPKKKGSPAPPRRVAPEIELPRRIEELLPHAPKKKESRVTFLLLEIFDAINPNLTPAERLDKASEILAPYILEVIKKKRKQSGTGPKPARKPKRAKG